MMRALIRELASAGAALSSLYPSTLGLYRKAGYEAAGVRFACAVPIARLEATVRELRLRPFEPRDLSGVQRVYRDRAARAAGNVERPERMWKRLLSYHSDDKIYANVVEGPDGAIVGYMIHIVISGEHCFDIRIRDMAALTPAAGRRLLTFLADHGTFGRRVVWNTGVIDPVFTLAREQPLTVEERGLWMLRIVRAREALQARGYPRGVRAELSLTLEDDLLPENCGRFTLRVADGNAELAEGGEGRIQVGVRGLASLYSGHRSALELQAAGLLDGPADDLSLADALFCGPTPWMNDGF
jgi:predicted acetyltransferase